MVSELPIILTDPSKKTTLNIKAGRYDPTLNGPIHNRSCTDIVWLILFILFLGGWLYLGYYSAQHGSKEKLIAPVNSNGKHCGIDPGYIDKPYLVYFDILKCLLPGAAVTGCATTKVCVDQCPTETIIFDENIFEESFEELKTEMICREGINVTTLKEAKLLVENGTCAKYVLKSLEVLGRCIVDPSEAVKVSQNITKHLKLNTTQALEQTKSLVQFDQIVSDLVQLRWYIVVALVAVVIVCFIYILLLRWVVAPVVWSTVALLFALFAFLIVFCYQHYQYYREHQEVHVKTNMKGLVQSWIAKPTTWLVILSIFCITFVVLLLIVIFLRSRIVIAIALIKEGSKAVIAIKSTVFFPIFPWLLQCAVMAYFVLVLVNLMSMGESAFKVVNFSKDIDSDCYCRDQIYTKDKEPCDPLRFNIYCSGSKGEQCQNATCHFQGLDSPTHVMYLHLFNLLGFFWTHEFISGVADMMLASTFATWYWTFQKKNLPFFTLTEAIFRVVRYHLGTVAFGSFIIAIIQVIRYLIESVDKKMKKFDNPFTRCLMCFCKCFLWCLESFMKFINKNAYIMCAVHGKNFCSSARAAFSLLMRNIVRTIVLDKVMDFIFILSKLFLSFGMGFAAYYLMQMNFKYGITKGEPLNYSVIPALIILIATYTISTIFFNVYAMAVDTLYLCFLEDSEQNDGSSEKPYFMSKNLMKILSKKKKKDS